MVELVVGVDTTESAAAVAEYLADTVGADDTVYVVNSLVGGDETSAKDVRAGEDAVEFVVDRLEDVSVVVETHQFVRGNEPIEDLSSFADEVGADEYVIGIRKRTPLGKIVFGSTAQNLLLSADRPVRCVPLVG